MQYLVSLGIDPSGVVIQRGAHNYAGPSCPGHGWTCTTASRVLQIAARAGDDNHFVCSPQTSSSGPGDCTIIQVSSSGNNVARCVEHSSDPAAVQSCQISQQNTTGANRIQIQQQVNVNPPNGSASESSSQYAGTIQLNGSGRNDVQIQQQLQQNSHDVASGMQSQNGHQAVYVGQTSDTGDNSAHVDQSLAQEAQAKGSSTATITENQNTDGAINTSAAVNQTSNTGANTAQVNQSNDQHAHVNKAASATQTQGSSGGGLAVFFDLHSAGVSTVQGQQHEHQQLDADQVGALTQNQYGPMWGDPTAVENVNDHYSLSQSSDEHASNPTNQDDEAYGTCDTSGHCTIDQHINVQGNNQQNSCQGTSCGIGLIVNGDGSSSTCSVNSDSESSCNVVFPSAPLPPFSDFTGPPIDSGPSR